MSELWYENIKVLFKNFDEFFPKKEFNQVQKINSMARFALYYALIIMVTNKDQKWLAVSLVILFISYSSGITESFSPISNISEDVNDKLNCVKPTVENPTMNFTIGDYYNNPNREKACEHTEEIKNMMSNKFNQDIVPDPYDLYGRKQNERQFITMPNTKIANDQKAFAEWCYGEIGQCKAFGKDCVKNVDNRYHATRDGYTY